MLFTDESPFCLTRGDGRIRIYRRRNERYTEACTLERDRFGDGGSIMSGGGVSTILETELRCILFPLIILEMFLQLDWRPPVVNAIDWT